MAETGKAKAGKPITDVAKPGKTAPSATSRPAIITNRPILKDPMIASANDTTLPEKETAEKHLSKPSTAVKLQPLEESAPEEKPEEPVTDTETVSTAKEADATPAEVPEVAETTKSEVTAGADEPTPEDDKGDVDGAQKASANDLEVEEAKRAEHQAAIEKLADSKQYYLPINSVERRRTKRIVVLGFLAVIVIAAALVDVGLDAGLIHIDGVKPVTHFFPDKS